MQKSVSLVPAPSREVAKYPPPIPPTTGWSNTTIALVVTAGICLLIAVILGLRGCSSADIVSKGWLRHTDGSSVYEVSFIVKDQDWFDIDVPGGSDVAGEFVFIWTGGGELHVREQYGGLLNLKSEWTVKQYQYFRKDEGDEFELRLFGQPESELTAYFCPGGF